MAHQLTTSHLADSIDLFRYYKKLAERALEQCPDDGLFVCLDGESNSIAIIVKHMAGNMRSRWSDFLNTDGEKPDRRRDTEFEEPPKTRAELSAMWEQGWKFLFDALTPLTDADLARTVTIRTEPHSVTQAINRQIAHYSYHTRPNRFPRQAFRRPIRQMERHHRPPQKIRRIQRQSRLRRSLSTLSITICSVKCALRRFWDSGPTCADTERFRFSPGGNSVFSILQNFYSLSTRNFQLACQNPPICLILVKESLSMQKTLFELGKSETTAPQLNEAQQRAITHGEGPLLVIAGAGTGKTRVIIERIRHLLESDSSLLGENILGLTFTNKAAGEMKTRVVKAVGERGKDVVLATFHSFCETILKEVDPNRLALESVDHWILLRRNLARLKLEKYRRLAEPGQFLSDFIAFFSRCQDELVSSEDYQAFADQLAAELQAEQPTLDDDTYKERAEQVALQQEIARAYRASEEILRDKRAIAINGSIAEAVTLAQKRSQSACASCVNATSTSSSTSFKTPTSLNSNCCTFSVTIPAISWSWATTIKPSTVFAAHLLAASNFSSSVSPTGARARIPLPTACR